MAKVKKDKCIGERIMDAMPMKPQMVVVVKKSAPKKRRAGNAKG